MPPPRDHRLLLLCSAVGTFAAGACGRMDVQPIQVALGCPDQPLRGADAKADEPSDRLLDDFEDGDGWVVKVAGRDGLWVEGDDHTSPMISWENSQRCAVRGTHAGHFSAAGLMSWGANLTGTFKRATAALAVPYDGTGYAGMSFWAAIGTGGPASLDVPVGVTIMETAWNGGGACVAMNNCMDFHRTMVTLTPEWRRISIQFSTLKQQGFGPPAMFRVDQLVGFIVWPIDTFDIWVDDVRLEPPGN